jgi:hypothetical protein
MFPDADTKPPSSDAEPKTLPAPLVIDAHTTIDLLAGMFDVMVAFGATLTSRDVLTRNDIAEMMTRVLDQQRTQAVDGPARRAAPEMMRDIFFRAVPEGGRGGVRLVAIKGGRDTVK